MLKQSLGNLLICLCLCAGGALPASGATSVDGKVLPAAPTASAKIVEANYCFAEAHGISPERLPVPPLVLRVRFQVLYQDNGNRPLILPLDHELTVWMSQGPGLMKVLHQPVSLSAPALKVMTHLPADVSPESPVDPRNDVFGVIPAGGKMNAPMVEEVTLQIYKNSLRQRIDLRGRRVYLRLQFDHQPLAAGLEAELSDRWAKFGVPWTGVLRTNTMVFDIPRHPQAKECVDAGSAHPARLKL